MAKFDNIIIVSDIDETFLGKKGRMVPENLEAIEYFKENGGSFTVATGREDYLILSSIPNIKDIVNIPIIGCNGSYICDMNDRSIKYEVFLDYDKVKPIIEHTAQLEPELWTRVSSDGKIYCRFLPSKSDGWYKVFNDRIIIGDIHTTSDTQRWHKILFEGTKEQVDHIREYLDTLDKDLPFEFIYAHPTVLEIMPKNGTKGMMLEKLKQVVGKPNATVLTAGDYENDEQMLRMADRCATPLNGMDYLKNIPGSLVLCDNDTGEIADLIRRIEKEIDG